MATKELAQGLASLGRGGDSTLVHMQPHEVAGLQALAKANGTSLTVNPDTGLPEAFSLGGFFSSLLPVFAGAATGGAGAPLWAGIAAGAATGAVTNRKDPLMGAITGGLGGYGGYNLGAAFAPGATAGTAGVNLVNPNVPLGQGVQIGGATGAGASTQMTPALEQSLRTAGANFDPIAVKQAQQIAASTTPGIQLGAQTANTILPGDPGYIGQGISGKDILTSGQPSSAIAGGRLPYGESLRQAGSNFGDFISGKPGSWDAFKQATGTTSDLMAAGKLAMPIGGAVLGGLEPSDLYGKPMKPDTRGAYDPYASLNLSGDTGLRLYAAGGPVSFADGGDSNKETGLSLTGPMSLPNSGTEVMGGGGADAMEGAGMLPLDVSDINAKYGFGEVGPVEAPKLGMFASNDQVNTARTAYEQQLKQATSGQGGMGSTAALMGGRGDDMRGGIQSIYELNAANQEAQGGGAPVAMRNMAVNNVASSAPTARTAQTALSRLNKQYAAGGTITSGGIRDLYGSPDDQTNGVVLSRDGYGLGRLQAMANGGMSGYAKGGYLDGMGDGMSDSIPATIEGKQPARLADGEFVVPADVVSHIGNGSSKAGAKRLYNMMDKVRQARTGTKKQGKQINPNKYLPK